MEKEQIKVIAVPGQAFQIVICKTGSGSFSFAKRWWDSERTEYGELGPICGIYDSAQTAEAEARKRTPGLAEWPNEDSVH